MRNVILTQGGKKNKERISMDIIIESFISIYSFNFRASQNIDEEEIEKEEGEEEDTGKSFTSESYVCSNFTFFC